MIEEQEIVKDPFALSDVDEETELRALTRALNLADGFTLIFALCNQAPHRRELMASVRSSLPDFKIQEIHLTESIPHLLNLLRREIQTPAPDAIFVSGIEYSLPVAAEAHNTPFVANLNASRNSFRQAVPCPLVLWLPEYALTAIMRGAPDFFSIRSGIYYFFSSAKEISDLIKKLPSDSLIEIGGLLYQEKLERLTAMESLLADYEALPEDKRAYKTEIRLNDKLADLYFVLGRFDDALSHTTRSLRLEKMIHGNLHPNIAKGLSNLALLYKKQGRYEEAEPLFKQSLEIWLKSPGKYPIDTATSLNNLALLYQTQKRYEEAEPLCKQALEITEELLGKEHPFTAKSLNNLAALYDSQEQYERAEALYKRALEIYEKSLGKEHPDTAVTLNNLSNVYYSQGRYEEAESSLKQSLEICEKLLGKEHPDIAQRLNNLALLYKAQGRYEEARLLFKQALEINEQVLGKENPATLMVRNNLQMLLDETKNFTDKSK
jgi:tetratricopeptide (TPR) repeat protein